MAAMGGNRWRAAASWLLRLLIACVVLVCIAVLVAGRETYWLTQAIVQKRTGCGVMDTLGGVRLAASVRRRSQALNEESRKLKRDPAGYVLWGTPLGEFWAPEKDDSLFFVLAELEHEPYATGRANVSRNDTVLDCGAHLGVYARQALQAGAKLVVAIEPGPRQIECLRRTFAAELAAGRVLIEPKGVWNKDGELDLYDTGDTAVQNVFGAPGLKSVKVPMITIDHLVTELGLKSVDFIKMDIEGAEPQALRGASATLRKFKPKLAIAAYHTPEDHIQISEVVLRENPTYHEVQIGCRVDVGATVPLTLMFY
jgi:FkbM family methyltransferase